MKTNVNTGSQSITRRNTAILLIGFLVPVLLFGILPVAMLNFSASEVKEKTTQKYAVDTVYPANEMYLVPKAYIYDQNEKEEDQTITLNKDYICFKDALLPSIGR